MNKIPTVTFETSCTLIKGSTHSSFRNKIQELKVSYKRYGSSSTETGSPGNVIIEFDNMNLRYPVHIDIPATEADKFALTLEAVADHLRTFKDRIPAMLAEEGKGLPF